jgi:hypothetical protein
MAELRVGFGAELLAPKRRFMFAGWEVLDGRRGGVASSLREMLTRECGVAWSRCLSYAWRIGVALKGSGCPSRRPGYDFTFLGRTAYHVAASIWRGDVKCTQTWLREDISFSLVDVFPVSPTLIYLVLCRRYRPWLSSAAVRPFLAVVKPPAAHGQGSLGESFCSDQLHHKKHLPHPPPFTLLQPLRVLLCFFFHFLLFFDTRPFDTFRPNCLPLAS